MTTIWYEAGHQWMSSSGGRKLHYPVMGFTSRGTGVVALCDKAGTSLDWQRPDVDFPKCAKCLLIVPREAARG